MKIRKILEDEMREALDLVWEVFLEFEAPDYTEEGIQEFKKAIDDEEWVSAREFYGAFQNNKILGVVATKDITHIALFFVDGKHHKQGIGTQLYNYVKELNNEDYFTVNSSPYAHEVYKHLGFIDTDKEQCIHGLRFIPMRKDFYKVNKLLQDYIENNVFPEYQKNEKGHNINHIKYVINRSFELVKDNNLNVNLDMVYTIASYHDIGHHIDSENHEKISADIMAKDINLKKFFNEEELKTIKEAIEDHRASSKNNPRSIYGEIVSSADRNTDIESCLLRTYTYGKKLDSNATDEELYERAYQVLVNKFGKNGYAKFFFKDNKYEDFLTEIRKILSDKDEFIKTQKEYIKKLQKENKL